MDASGEVALDLIRRGRTEASFVDPPHDSGSQPDQLTPTWQAHEHRRSIGDATEATRDQHSTQDALIDADANVDTEGAPASNASALQVEDGDKEDCYVYVEVTEEPVANANQPESLPKRLLVGKRTFALRKSTEAQKRARIAQATETNGFTDWYDYLKKYPADPPEEGMEPNARVWRVYLDEVEQFDIDMVDNFRDTVDVMLVFAGLFSAVVTTFVAQASTALQVDYTQVAASAALEQLALSRAFYSGSPIPDPSPSTLTLDSSATTAFDRWVNGLWFTSLSLSLATALFAVLIKQWIQAYVSPVSGTPQERARIRQYRYLGLEKWHVYGIIGLLPTLLHLSLFLFLTGLAVFLFPLDHIIAKVTASIAGSAAAIYVFSNLAPVFDSQCPYKTPLSNYSLVLLHPLVPILQVPFRILRAQLQALMHMFSPSLRIIHQSFVTALRTLARSLATTPYGPQGLAWRLYHSLGRRLQATEAQSSKRISALSFVKKVELKDISLISDGIDAEALCWVVTWSSNPSVKAVVVEAAGDLRIGYEEQAKDILRDGGVADAAYASLEMCTEWQGGYMEMQSGLENPHLRATLAHFQLGLMFNAHRNVDGHLSPYFSLLQPPSWELVRPQHIVQSSLPNSPKIVFLLSLRRAASYLRTNSSSRLQADNIDWLSSQKLCGLVQLEPPPDDLFGLWQTTLVSIYLASLVPEVAPISEDSGLVFKLLFNHIELGSSELPKDLAIKLSVESCVEFLGYTLKSPATATDFSSSDKGSQFIEHLCSYFDNNGLWVSDPGKIVVGPHHTLLVALLDHSEKQGGSIFTGLRTLIYNLGCNMMARDEPRSSDPDLDLVPLLRRLLKAALIPPQLSVPDELLSSQIHCLHTVLRNSLHESLSALLDIFRQYDGISALEKMIQSVASQHVQIHTGLVEHSLVFYLNWVFPVGENSLPSPDTAITQPGGQAAGRDNSDHLSYILQHLVQIIRTCVALCDRKISHSETNSYPRTLQVLRRILEAQPEASPEWSCAFAELETEGMSSLRHLDDKIRAFDEDNLKEILSILRSDLEAPRSPDVQGSSQPEPLLPRSLISEVAQIDSGSSQNLGPTAAEEVNHPPTHVGSLLSRWTRQLRTGGGRLMPPRQVEALIPLHNRTPPQPVQESESAAGDAVEEERPMARRDEEEGVPASDGSAP